jgi:hypothetical protein
MNNFAELSRHDGEGVQFLVRWRGKQEGPYSASVIETKLQNREMGLLHEISHNGRWISIRDYMTEKVAALQVEKQIQEEQERRVREEAERQAHEREEQHRIAVLAEERRKAAQLDSAQLQQSFEQRIPLSHSPQKNHGSSGLQIIGTLFLIGGLAVIAYFFLAFDTSVESGFGRVNNLGLMADRQNGIIIGVGLSLVGTIMFVIASRNKN